MANQWFKFYGGEYLADTKIRSFSAAYRSCWITLLCYASQTNGVIKYLSEEQLKIDAGLPIGSESNDTTKNVLETFINMDMITVDNGVITVTNWAKRQESPMTPYERVKKYREKKRKITPDNKIDNDRIEENRIEENRRDKSMDTQPKNKFSKPTVDEIQVYCIERKNSVHPQKFFDYYESNGWKVGRNPMKNWRAAIRTWEKNESHYGKSPPVYKNTDDAILKKMQLNTIR